MKRRAIRIVEAESANESSYALRLDFAQKIEDGVRRIEVADGCGGMLQERHQSA